jgi:hypothetical protein
MKTALLLKTTFSVLIILSGGIFYESKAQVVVIRSDKKSGPGVFVPTRKSTHPVIIRKGHNLPPGQEKKIYGSKSAKPYAPGQRKKTYHKHRKHQNKKWEHQNKK